MIQKVTNTRGFTLIEVLLSVVLIAFITGVSVPIYRSYLVKNNLDTATMIFVQSLRRAQGLSQAGEGDTTWGVNIETGLITVFKGASYAARDTTYDETFTIADSIGISGVQEIVFSKMYGEPQTTGSVTLSSDMGHSKTITINGKGFIDY